MKFIIATDLHGDLQDRKVVAKLLSEVQDYPLRIFGGDLWDFRNLRQGAKDDEKAETMLLDWQMGEEFIEAFFDGAEEAHWLLGNHDWRLWNGSNNATGLVRDYCRCGVKRVTDLARKLGARLYPYDIQGGVCTIMHKFQVVHGYSAAMHSAKAHAEIYPTLPVFFGHVHRAQRYDTQTLPRSFGQAIPCLAQLAKYDPDFSNPVTAMSYASSRKATLSQSNGWCVGEVTQKGFEYEIRYCDLSEKNGRKQRGKANRCRVRASERGGLGDS